MPDSPLIQSNFIQQNAPMSQATLGPGSLLDEDFIRSQFKQLGKNVKIFTGARIDNPEAVSVGDHTQIDEGVFLFAGKGIAIGRHVHLASRPETMDHLRRHATNGHQTTRQQRGNHGRPIKQHPAII